MALSCSNPHSPDEMKEKIYSHAIGTILILEPIITDANRLTSPLKSIINSAEYRDVMGAIRTAHRKGVTRLVNRTLDMSLETTIKYVFDSIHISLAHLTFQSNNLESSLVFARRYRRLVVTALLNLKHALSRSPLNVSAALEKLRSELLLADKNNA